MTCTVLKVVAVETHKGRPARGAVVKKKKHKNTDRWREDESKRLKRSFNLGPDSSPPSDISKSESLKCGRRHRSPGSQGPRCRDNTPAGT